MQSPTPPHLSLQSLRSRLSSTRCRRNRGLCGLPQDPARFVSAVSRSSRSRRAFFILTLLPFRPEQGRRKLLLWVTLQDVNKSCGTLLPSRGGSRSTGRFCKLLVSLCHLSFLLSSLFPVLFFLLLFRRSTYSPSFPSSVLIFCRASFATVSDREAFPSLPSFPPTFVPLAAKLYAEGQRDELIHGGIDAFGVDVTVYRAWSLVCEGYVSNFIFSARRDRLELTFLSFPLSSFSFLRQIGFSGDDDYFSLLSPLPHSTTFAKLPTSTPILFLFSSHDEYTPNASTTQPALLKAWLEAVPKNLRAEGATLEGGHALKPELGEMGVSKGWEGLGEEVRKWLS